ncbi:MAG: hypothetical protein MZV65_53910 [Chromatiales bacterium]|nr:hypothetical protein [Chromatiales bacterium]
MGRAERILLRPPLGRPVLRPQDGLVLPAARWPASPTRTGPSGWSGGSLDPKQFWGDFVVPSVSPRRSRLPARSQRSWRGAVRPPLNYLIYQGLKAYGFDAVASELARKGADMFLRELAEASGLAPRATIR